MKRNIILNIYCLICSLVSISSSALYGQGLRWYSMAGRYQNVFVFNTEGNTLFASSGKHGLYRSIDSGYSWDICSPGFAPDYIVRYDSNNVFAYNANSLSRSSDNGKTWETEPSQHFIRSMTVLRKTVFMSAGYDTGNYLLRSNDIGKTWERMPFLFTENVVITKIDTSLIAFGENQVQYRSEDEGRTWRKTASVINIPRLYAVSKTAI